MAGIDKTYINGADYPLYRKWWIENYEKMMKELGTYIWLYPFSTFYPDEPEEFTPEFLLNNTKDLDECKGRYDFPVWNTTEKQDMWLVTNCPITSFRNRMLEVYSIKWKGFKGQKWAKQNYKPKCVK